MKHKHTEFFFCLLLNSTTFLPLFLKKKNLKKYFDFRIICGYEKVENHRFTQYSVLRVIYIFNCINIFFFFFVFTIDNQLLFSEVFNYIYFFFIQKNIEVIKLQYIHVCHLQF